MDADITVTVFIYCFASICGLLFNGLLIYLVLCHTPKSMETYSSLIFNVALCDFVCCLFTFSVQDRMIPAAESLFFIGNGPCRFINAEFCFQSHNIMLHCYTHSLWSALLAFSYRLYILHRPVPRTLSIRALILVFYVPSFIQLLAMGSASDPEDSLKEILKKRYPQYSNYTGALFGVENVIKFTTLYTILHVSLPVTPVYIAIIVIRLKTIKSLQSVENMSNNTQSMHRRLLKVLTYQACLPMLFLIAIIAYVLGALDIYHHPLLEYFALVAPAFIPMFTALISLFFIRPYQKWIYSQYTKLRKQNIVQVSDQLSALSQSRTFHLPNVSVDQIVRRTY